MYQPLLDEIGRRRGRAASFHRVDLHVHSHDSDDFGKLGDKHGCCTALSERDRAPTAEYFLEAAKGAALALMAVTDHNRSTISESIAALADKPLVVLPGMEVSLQTSFFPDSVIHVLAIFPESYTSADIERVFARGDMPPLRSRKSDAVLSLSVNDFLQAVHSNGGICIASHVNSSSGIRNLFRQSNTKLLRLQMRRKGLEERMRPGALSEADKAELLRLEASSKQVEDAVQNQFLLFLAEHRFDAIEVQCSAESRFYTGSHTDELGIAAVPCVVGSDAHNLSDVGLKGYTTYVKMTSPGFADLRKALRDPGTRLRFEDDVPHVPVARILGLQFERGFFHGHTIGFSDNLTCLIGARGSGKSATIEALRYVFGQPTEHLSRDKREDLAARLQHTLEGATVKVVFCDKQGDTYVLVRFYGEGKSSCYDADGNALTDIEVAHASNLHVRIFGWGEIEELARRKREQLELIDGFVAGAKEAKQHVQDWMGRLRSNTSRAVTLAQELEDLLPRVAELPTKLALLSKLSSDALNAIFEEYDRNQAALSSIEAVQAGTEEIWRPFVQPDGCPYAVERRLLELLEDATPRLDSYNWLPRFASDYHALVAAARAAYETLLGSGREISNLVAQVRRELDSERVRMEVELNRAAEDMADPEVKALLPKRRNLTAEVAQLRGIQAQIDQKHEEICDLLGDRWARIVPELHRARRALTRLRRAALRPLNERLSALSSTATVTVRLLHQKDRDEFVLALGSDEKDAPEGVLKYVYKFYRRDKYAKLYAARHSPHTFVRAVLSPDPESIAALCAWTKDETGGLKEVITREKAADVRSLLLPYLDGGRYCDSERLERLLALEHADTEDLPVICLQDRALEELSPGQRCSALIPIILLESDSPLVIDQPEDNLDNRLVFGLVVDIIRALKERRQIIVATHNPNIPVSGDAEQIVVFEAPTRQLCERAVQGSIDCDDIVEHVKAIMEGSEEAFRIRAQKYGYEFSVRALRHGR